MSTPQLIIRPVEPHEYDLVGDATADAYLASYTNLSAPYIASMRDVASKLHDGEVWVATDTDGTILGSVWVAAEGAPLSDDAQPGETDFRQLAVSPAARGRGVGEALTRHVIKIAAERGSHMVFMNSGKQMTGAHALYTKMGFRRLTEREHPIEVEPGRWIELLAFGLDLPSTQG